MAMKRFKIPSIQEMEEENVNSQSSKVFKPGATNQNETSKEQKSADTVAGQKPLLEKEVPMVESTSSSKDGTEQNQKYTDQQEAVSSATTGKSSSCLLVNPRQRGNPILKSVRNVAWEYGNIVPDYVMGQSNCALFLSLRYHQLHPDYVHQRLQQLGRAYSLRVMLVQVDVKDPQHLLKEIAKICILADCTLILAFSAEEAGKYLETYKIFENKPPEAIMEKTEEDFMSKMTDCMTKVKSVNKTDCATLITQFGSVSNIIDASEEDLSLCPGFGPQKAKRLHSLFREPFRRKTNTDPSNNIT